MRHPKSLEALVEHGIIEEVLRPLMSGKEAQVYLVASEEGLCAAKVYKDAEHRSFKNRADYTEGRTVRNSRDQRAIAKRSKYGKGKDEEAWKSTEVDMIYRLRDGGVRVPTPYMYIDGVLLMELVVDGDGNPAPRLGDLEFTPQEATEVFHRLLAEVVRMLCIGVVHGDFSEFNVLYGEDGPVVIDFPQSINAAGNLSARKLLIRDVDNLHRFLARWVPGARRRPYAEEMWALYEENRLTPDTELLGRFQQSRGPVDTSEVLALIGDADRDENRRRLNAGAKPVAPVGAAAIEPTLFRRREVIVERPAPRPARAPNGPRANSSGGNAGPRSGPSRSDVGPRNSNSRPDHRGPPGRHGTPAYTRPDSQKKSGPKRGDVVQNSTYVSPEARKLNPKSLALTPRNANPSPDDNRRSAPHGSGQNRQGAGSFRDRNAARDRHTPRDRNSADNQGSSRDRNTPARNGALNQSATRQSPARERNSTRDRSDADRQTVPRDRMPPARNGATSQGATRDRGGSERTGDAAKNAQRNGNRALNQDDLRQRNNAPHRDGMQDVRRPRERNEASATSQNEGSMSRGGSTPQHESSDSVTRRRRNRGSRPRTEQKV